jgi:formate-dependent nitrite reductase membrane component NrfD
MKPYLWMTDYTPQEEWIDRQGLLLWLAFFFTEIGAGLYLVSLLFRFWNGCIVGWLISAVLGGGLHTLYLGRPERAWRAILRPVKSELSRGLIIMILFLLLGAIQVAPSLPWLGSLPWQSDSSFLTVVVGILAFFVILHGFLTMNVMASIPFWNSAILPILSIASGIWIGSQLTLFFSLSFSEREVWMTLEPVARWSLFSYALLIFFYLWNASHASSAVQESLGVLLKGEMSLPFYLGVVLIGLVIPLAVTIGVLAGSGPPSQGLLVLRVVCAVLGDAVLRYVITKCGRYSPLIYSNVVKG